MPTSGREIEVTRNGATYCGTAESLAELFGAMRLQQSEPSRDASSGKAASARKPRRSRRCVAIKADGFRCRKLDPDHCRLSELGLCSSHLDWATAGHAMMELEVQFEVNREH